MRNFALSFVLVLVNLAVVSSHAVAQTPSARVSDSAEVHKATVYKLTDEFPYETVYTDRKGCTVSVKSGVREGEISSIDIAATVGDTTQEAWVRPEVSGNGARFPVRVTFHGQEYDRTKGPDLISRKCAAMVKAIPDEAVRNLALRAVVE